MSAAVHTLGGSEIAAAAGVHPHLSPVMLWAQKTGRAPTHETEAMEWGTRLEPVIREACAERGYPVTEAPPAYVDPDREWLVGHPDGWTMVEGLHAIAELKTAGEWAYRAGWNDGPPPQYVAQAQTYMHLTGSQAALVAVLIGGQRLDLSIVRRDDYVIGLLLAQAESFYAHLLDDTMPAPDETDSTKEALLALFPKAHDKRARLMGDDWRALRELRSLKARAAVLAEQITERENIVKAALGDAETGIDPNDNEVVRWTNVSTNRVDTARLKRDRPELAGEYTTTSTTRRFALL